MIEKLGVLFAAIKIETKTRFLLLLISGGILTAGLFSYLSLYALKYDFDALFNHRTISSVKLQELKDIFAVNILDTTLEVEKNSIELQKGENVVILARELAFKEWNSYKRGEKLHKNKGVMPAVKKLSYEYFYEDKYKKPLASEEDYTESIDNAIGRIDFLCEKIFSLFKEHRDSEAKMLISDELYPAINAVNIKLSELIRLQMESAIYEKEITDNLYKVTGVVIFLFLAYILAVSIMLARIILKGIAKINKNLEQSVEEKTKELSELNKSLKDRVAKEVEENRRKDQIMQYQARLAGMGEMIANIAHQWRQPLNALTAIIQSFETKQMVGKLDEKFIVSQVEEGIKIASKMSTTIDDFRNFFKPDKVKTSFEICESINKAVSMFDSYCVECDIKLTVLCSQKMTTTGFENEFLQAAINILNNSKDALNENKIPSKTIAVIVRRAGTNANIYFIDNAGGIPANIIDRIFEPYFTTKHKSTGTGIGLYMTRQIVQNHKNGALNAKNVLLNLDGQIQKCAMFRIRVGIDEICDYQ